MAAKDPRNPEEPSRHSQTGGGEYQAAAGQFGAPGGAQEGKAGAADSESEINVGLHLFEGAEQFQSFITELKTANEHMRALGQSRTVKDEVKAHKGTQEQGPDENTQTEIRDLLKQISEQISVFGADATSTPGAHPGTKSGVSDDASTLGEKQQGQAPTAEDMGATEAKKDLGTYAKASEPTIPTDPGLKGTMQKIKAVGRGARQGWKTGKEQFGDESEWAQGRMVDPNDPSKGRRRGQAKGPDDPEDPEDPDNPIWADTGRGPLTGEEDDQGLKKRRGHKAAKLTGALVGASQGYLLRADPPVGKYTESRDWDDDKAEEGGQGHQQIPVHPAPRRWESIPEWERKTPEGQRQQRYLAGKQTEQVDEAKKKQDDEQAPEQSRQSQEKPAGGTSNIKSFSYNPASVSGMGAGVAGATGAIGGGRIGSTGGRMPDSASSGGGPIRVIESTNRLDRMVAAIQSAMGPTSPGQRGFAMPTTIPGAKEHAQRQGKAEDAHGQATTAHAAKDQSHPGQTHYPSKHEGQPDREGAASNERKKQQAEGKKQAKPPTEDESKRFSADTGAQTRSPRAGSFTAQNMEESAEQKLTRSAEKAEARGQAAPLRRAGAALAGQAAAKQPTIDMYRQMAGQARQKWAEHIQAPTQVGAIEGADPLSGGSFGGQNSPINSAFLRGEGEKLDTKLRALTTPGLTSQQAGQNKLALQNQGFMSGAGPFGDVTKQMRNVMDRLASQTAGNIDPQTVASVMGPSVRYGTATPMQNQRSFENAWTTANQSGQNPQLAVNDMAQFGQQQQQQGATSLQGFEHGRQMMAATGIMPTEMASVGQSSLGKANVMGSTGLMPGTQGLATGGAQASASAKTVQQYMGMFKNMPATTEQGQFGTGAQHPTRESQIARTAEATGSSPDVINYLDRNAPLIQKAGDLDIAFGGVEGRLNDPRQSVRAAESNRPSGRGRPSTQGSIDEGFRQTQAAKGLSPKQQQEQVNKMHEAGQQRIHDIESHKEEGGGILPTRAGTPNPLAKIPLVGGLLWGSSHPAPGTVDAQGKPIDTKDPRARAQAYTAGEKQYAGAHDKPPPPPGDQKGDDKNKQQIDLTPAAKKFFQMVPNPNNTNQQQANAGQSNPNTSAGSGPSPDIGVGGGL